MFYKTYPGGFSHTPQNYYCRYPTFAIDEITSALIQALLSLKLSKNSANALDIPHAEYVLLNLLNDMRRAREMPSWFNESFDKILKDEQDGDQ